MTAPDLRLDEWTAVWVEPAEQIVSIYFIQGGSGGALRQDFENAVYQSIVAP